MTRRSLQPLDRLALFLMVLLAGVMVVLIVLGDHVAAQVREFSWQERQVGHEDIAFLMRFSRPMNTQSVEKNLKIEPSLPGKFSWAGRRMAYTLDFPAPYGETFKVTLDQAEDSFRADQSQFQGFSSQFMTRDRAFLYIGVEGDYQGRLILYNLTQQTETPLTPKDWVVLNFKPYGAGDRVLFSATDYKSYQQGDQNQKIYQVTTGLNPPTVAIPAWKFWQRSPSLPDPAVITEVLGSDVYQNLKFDLSPDGQNIVVQRINREDPNDFGPWVLSDGQPPRPLETDPGGDFIIAPDSQSLLLQQGEGTAVISLTSTPGDDPTEAVERVGDTLDFLPEYGLVLDVATDGSAAAMVSFNQNDPEQRYTQTLFWVSSQNEEKPLLTATGAILNAQFDPTNELLYCLISQLLPGETYQVQPYLIAVNVKTGELYDLLAMPAQPSVNISLSPDGLAVLFDETVTDESQESTIRSEDGLAIATSKLWLLPLFQTSDSRLGKVPAPAQPQALPFSGLHPAWLP